jgi:hypothetical protein
LKSWEGKDVHSAMRRVQNEEYDHNRPASGLRISFAKFKDQSAPDPRGVAEFCIVRHGQRRSRETGKSTHYGSHNSYTGLRRGLQVNAVGDSVPNTKFRMTLGAPYRYVFTFMKIRSVQ